MSTSCGESRRTKKWTKKLFFHLTVLAIVIVLIIHRSWRIYDNTDFREQLMRYLVLVD
jgi:hypothetical protein